MGKFLTLITIAAMALFIAGPAMAQDAWKGEKKYTFNKTVEVDVDKNIDIKKDIDVDLVNREMPANVEGDVVFGELDVEVQDNEVVNKFFELDEFATSNWSIDPENQHGVMNVAEVLQNGVDNISTITQNPGGVGHDQMNVGLQYQLGTNTATITQQGSNANDSHTHNFFAKQVQIGGTTARNTATINQDGSP